MSNLDRNFNTIANDEEEKSKYPPPFSLRLTYEERARLDAERGDKSLAAFIRGSARSGHRSAPPASLGA